MANIGGFPEPGTPEYFNFITKNARAASNALKQDRINSGLTPFSQETAEKIIMGKVMWIGCEKIVDAMGEDISNYRRIFLSRDCGFMGMFFDALNENNCDVAGVFAKYKNPRYSFYISCEGGLGYYTKNKEGYSGCISDLTLNDFYVCSNTPDEESGNQYMRAARDVLRTLK
jgi:hypothetical protein